MNWIRFLVCFLILLCGPVLAADETAAPSSVGTLIWAFANSPIGVTVLSALGCMVIGAYFKRHPEWKQTFDQHNGLFFDAVRHAEKAIPDDVPNPAAQKADMALKFILKLEPGLSGKKEVDLRRAITEAHDKLKE